MERFKAGIGFGICAALVIFVCEDIFGFKITRDGLALLVMAATALGSSWTDATVSAPPTTDKDRGDN